MAKTKMPCVGDVYGRLTVLEVLEVGSVSAKFKCICSCECGGVKEVSAHGLRHCGTKSCGCLQRESVIRMSTSHGMTKTKEHRIWCGMLSRCNNPNGIGYTHYGARGVKVCDEWSSFENFFADMGPCPEGASLDRIDTLKGYSADNCRWASRSEQTVNARLKSNNTSGRTGVKWLARLGKWQADIMYGNGKYKYGGVYENFEDAVKARELLEVEYHGQARPPDYEDKSKH